MANKVPLEDPGTEETALRDALREIVGGFDDTGAPIAAIAVGALAAQVRGGPLQNGIWTKLPAIYRILLGGTGTVSIDTRARDGTITTGVVTYSPTGPAEDYPYFDNAYEVRATLTGTATAEIV